jgi:DNA-binding transcriptional regulator YhcF (GntR family)
LFKFSDYITVNDYSTTTKYEQIAKQIIDLIRKGVLYKGQKLPPINVAYKELGISRDTLIAAYKELQANKIIESVHGKGFYITLSTSLQKKKIFLLFDVMNGYKEVLYQSMVQELGTSFETDIYFHYYNLKLFEKLIHENSGYYDHYVIMPHFNVDVSAIVRKIPLNKLFIIDKPIPQFKEVPTVFQDFENDVFTALDNCIAHLKRYNTLCMMVNRDFQFIPDGILLGFERFCKKNNIKHLYIENIANHNIKQGEAYICFTDHDLVNIIKFTQQNGLKLGTDIGLISYDDTPLKEILSNGITVMTTDFDTMGKTVANMIKNNKRGKIANPFRLILRNSL